MACPRPPGGLVASVIGLFVLLAGCVGSSPAPGDGRLHGQGSSPGPPVRQAAVARGSTGTVDTIAGPGFCKGAATLDKRSSEVRSLAVDGEGRVFFDTGPAGEGLIGKVEPDGSASTFITGMRSRPSESPRPAAGSPLPVLAIDPRGGLFAALGDKLYHLGSDARQTRVAAGEAGAGPGASAPAPGDAGIPRADRTIEALAADEAGNLYMIDKTGRAEHGFRLRFRNNGAEAVTFFAGTSRQQTAAPAETITIADSRTLTAAAVPGRILPDSAWGPVRIAVKGEGIYLAFSPPAAKGRAPKANVLLMSASEAPFSTHGMTVAPGAVESVIDPKHNRRAGLEGSVSQLSAIAADQDGNLFLADELDHRILKVDPGGTVSTVAGGDRIGPRNAGFNGNDRPAVGALLNRPGDVKVGPEGRLYIADTGNGQIRIVDREATIRSGHGNGVGATWNCAGRAAGDSEVQRAVSSRPRAAGPAGLASDQEGGVHFTLFDGNLVKKIDRRGTVTSVAGGAAESRPCSNILSCPGFAGDGKAASASALSRPSALAQGRLNGLYILDSGNLRVRLINPGQKPIKAHGVKVAPGAIQTVAGNGEKDAKEDKESAGKAVRKATDTSIGPFFSSNISTFGNFLVPLHPAIPGALQPGDLGSLAADGQGNLFVADPSNHRVHKVDPTGRMTAFAGEGAPSSRESCCTDPTAIAADRAGNLLVGDRKTHRIWLINTGSKPIASYGQVVQPGGAAPVAGNGAAGLAEERFRAVDTGLFVPMAITMDRSGNIYLAQSGGLALSQITASIHKIDTAGIITTMVGTGQNAFNGDGLRGRLTSLSYPTGLAMDHCGNLLIADPGSDRIRRLNLTHACSS